MNTQDLKKVGLKTTTPRVKILEMLETSKEHHLSADDIYRNLVLQNIDIGFATIYRVLGQFEKSGIVNKLNFNNQSVFELATGEHHDHLLCVKCGHIEEFKDSVIEQHQEDIAKNKGFTLTDHCLYLYGVCSSCQQEVD